jgi:hypothetical protein
MANGLVSPVDVKELNEYLASWFSIAFGNSTSFNFSLPTDKPPPLSLIQLPLRSTGM